ncbi:Putative SirA family protein, partial [Candidatus Arthromitus sp. SFB-2]
CPIPLVETRKFINNNKNVDFKIILDNEVSFINIKKVFREQQNKLIHPIRVVMIFCLKLFLMGMNNYLKMISK